MAAPHSIAGAWMGLSATTLGWLGRSFAIGTFGIRRTLLDAPLWLLFAWTALSSVFSVEPAESLPKLVNAATFLTFYLAQALLTRTRAVSLALILIVSGVAGVVWSVAEIARGRGVVITEIAPMSPFSATPLRPGDAVWRVNKRRVSSIEEIDAAVRNAPVDTPLSLSVISRGEHVEWQAPAVVSEQRPSTSGLAGAGRTHYFRASGWTRHYETHAEVLQMLAQLSLGFALAYWMRRRASRYVLLAASSFALLATGVALTAMRTVIIALDGGALVIAWLIGKRARPLIAAIVALVLIVGAFVVWRTRAGGALSLSDPSASSRLTIARIAASRVREHPVLGHGMDAVHRHWQDWGFPGTDMLHAHSTPVQLAFDRGLPAVALWLWLIFACWTMARRAERLWRETDDARAHGLMLGTTGALAGFFLSSLVNYNFGDAEVMLLVWWLMGAVVACGRERTNRES
jgi:hypothetical protein